VETDNNTILRLSLAVFFAILIHSLVAFIVYLLDVQLIEIKEKTIPFKLVSNSRASKALLSSSLSAEENARAAQEYLSTLNQSQFNSASAQDSSTDGNHGNGESSKTSKQQPTEKQLPQNTPLHRGSNPSSAISGLQSMFSQKKQTIQTNNARQISTKQLELLSDYEILLLNTLNKGALYDAFHEVLDENKKLEVSYVITLFLFPNGAIKNAAINKSSGLPQIDELAIQAAYRASPFPAPPRDDIQKGYRYHIPIIVKDE
jgi:TonB family protein